MFIRTVQQINGKVSILIVENIRISGKPKQKTLRHVATVPPEEIEMFKKVAEHIKIEMEMERESKSFPSRSIANTVINSRNHINDIPLHVNLSKMMEEYRIVTGIHEIYGCLYNMIKFSKVFKSCPTSEKILKNIVMARLAKPCSKRSSSELLERDFGIAIPLIKIYRMMDKFTEERIKEIQDLCWRYSKGLFIGEIKVMFYDCTTLYFESFTEDDLRKFGFSKDHKFNQGQILLALMVTQEGLPIGYEIFPGNINEGKTFKQAIEKIKNRYKINKVIIVADSGLLSQENIDLLEKEEYDYILGARLKSLTTEWQNKVLFRTDYMRIEKDDDILQITTYEYTVKRTLIVTYSSKRAEKDRRDREKAIEKLQQKLKNSKKPESLISNYGYKKFIVVDGKAQIRINEDKLKKEVLWDGLGGIFTNIKKKDMKVTEVLNQYHGLWQIEESFRINKHDLRMRPVFHWNPDRIRAHISICFMAFALIRFLQYKIKLQIKESLSAERIKRELYSIQESILKDTTDHKRYVIPSKPSEDAIKIYKSMNMRRDVKPFTLK